MQILPHRAFEDEVALLDTIFPGKKKRNSNKEDKIIIKREYYLFIYL